MSDVPMQSAKASARRASWIGISVLVLIGLLGAGCSGPADSAATPALEVGRFSQPEPPDGDAMAELPTEREPSLLPQGLKLLAHRGVHHTFDSDGIDDETCTATRIDPPTHSLFENTLASMTAAFAAGAVVVEIDIAPTSDGVLAVFHDWDVGCRTNGSGAIRSLSWEELSQLDIGYGYTADGSTYPLRGQGEGLMPRLEEVFAAFPDGRFLINFKSGDPTEAELLEQVVDAADATDQVWAVYGGAGAVDAYVAATGARGFSESSVAACIADYVVAVDSDERLAACENTVLLVPTNIAPALPGWPNDFVETMVSLGTDVIIVGSGLNGIDTQAQLDLLPDLDAFVWTNKIEELTPR